LFASFASSSSNYEQEINWLFAWWLGNGVVLLRILVEVLEAVWVDGDEKQRDGRKKSS